MFDLHFYRLDHCHRDDVEIKKDSKNWKNGKRKGMEISGNDEDEILFITLLHLCVI